MDKLTKQIPPIINQSPFNTLCQIWMDEINPLNCGFKLPTSERWKKEKEFFRLSTTITKIISPSHGFENPLTNKGQFCFCLGFFITNQIFSFQTGRRLISVAVATKKTILLPTDCLCWRCHAMWCDRTTIK